MKRTALITGIAGQDGSYLAEFLLKKHYTVCGLVRNSNMPCGERIAHLQNRIRLISGDLLDADSLARALKETEPDELYNLASPSSVRAPWEEPVAVGDAAALGVNRILEAIRLVRPRTRFFQASSSEMFGNAQQSPQNETTQFRPRNPYGVAKLYAHWMTVNYRESHGIFACSGILFNHESPRRGMEFVTRKVTCGAARIKLGLQEKLLMGSLDAKRDWGFAGDYVRAMWLMLQRDKPDDYVIATGVVHSVRHLVELAFGFLSLDYRDYVQCDPSFSRPAEHQQIVGDNSKAQKELDWMPKVDFERLIKMMIDEDLTRLRTNLAYGMDDESLS